MMIAHTFSDVTKQVPFLIREGELRVLESLHTIKDRSPSSKLKNEISHFIQTIHLKGNLLSAWAFLGYYTLGTTLSKKDDIPEDKTIEIINNICALIEKYPTGKKFIAYGDTEYTTRKVWSHLLQVLQDGDSFPDDITPPNPKTLKSIEKTIQQTHQIIKSIDPGLKAMMEKLQELIIAGQPGIFATQKKQQFGGATCFFFRGGTIINSASIISKAKMVERLIHEYAHAELFTMAQKELLCQNTDDKTYPILIRSDPRPMNGIIHSLYVVCRVADFQGKIIRRKQSFINEPSFIEETKHIFSEQLTYGRSSLRAIRDHAKLTPLGNMVTNLCEDFLNIAKF